MDMTRKEIIAVDHATTNIKAHTNPEKIYNDMMNVTDNKKLALVGDSSINWFIKKLGDLSDVQKNA